MMEIIDLILHVDAHLREWTLLYGSWIYLLLFLIVFCETGLVVTPFLPGDSLLFAAGALTALGSSEVGGGAGLEIWTLSGLLICAAVAGDQLNYTIGARLGRWLLHRPRPLIRLDHLRQTEKFMAKYGAAAIVLARFAPIVRTFAPFVAGLGAMDRKRFLVFNILGGLLWVLLFLWLGRWFGNLPLVQKNFSLVILGIVVVSLIPLAVGWLKARQDLQRERQASSHE